MDQAANRDAVDAGTCIAGVIVADTCHRRCASPRSFESQPGPLLIDSGRQRAYES